jgi:hypothetical protein
MAVDLHSSHGMRLKFDMDVRVNLL